jgi:hypothetical protein
VAARTRAVTRLPARRRHPAALLLAAVLMALGALWAGPAPAFACSCAAASDDQYAVNAAAIFTGTLVENQVDEPAQTRTLTFAVDRVFKGQVTATQVVTSQASGASCGVELSGPGPFLVFAQAGPTGLTADLCGGTRSGSAPVGLGVGDQPQPDPARPATGQPDGEPRSGMWIPLVGFILALTAAAVVGLSLVRPRSS